MIAFLRWWLLFWLSVGGAVAAWALGFYSYLWISDASYLSWACLGLYALMTAFIGQITYRARFGCDVREHLPLCTAMVGNLTKIGLIGTLCGFMMIPAAIKAGIGDPAKVLSLAADGLSTAGLTTIVGLVCSMLLHLQVINLRYLVRSHD